MAEVAAAVAATTSDPSVSIDSSTPAQSREASSDVTPPPETISSPSGPQKTPFAHPDPAAVVSDEPPLTTDQMTAYNSLLNSVSTWTTIPTSSATAAPHTPLTDAELMWLTRQCLLRYLRASKWSVQTAQTRLLATMIWRRTYGIVAPSFDTKPKLTADYISIENETGKQWLLGYDNAGRPCHYLNPSRQNTKRSDKQIEHLVFMLERAIDIMPPGQETLALLINFAEASSGQSASIGQGKQTIGILQNHYPERLGRALLCNLPWHFWAFMKVITPFIDPITRSKIIYNESLQKHVPPSQLKKSHGGDLEFEYDHTAYWTALNTLADQRIASMNERWIAGGRRVGESELYLRGGVETGLSKEEEGRLGREKGSLRGRTDEREEGKKEKREKSVAILEAGQRVGTGDSLKEPAKGTAPTTQPEQEQLPQQEYQPDQGETVETLDGKIEGLALKEDGAAANGAPSKD